MISNDSKAWEKIYNPIVKEAEKFCKHINAYDDVFYWYVAEEVAKKILDKNLTIDKECAEQVFEWRDLGVSEYDDDVWEDFEKHVKEVE